MPLQLVERFAAHPNALATTVSFSGLEITAEVKGLWYGESVDVEEKATLTDRSSDSSVEVYLIKGEDGFRVLVSDSLENNGSVALDHFQGLNRVLRLALLRVPKGTVDLNSADAQAFSVVSRAP
jgi:hypothetical protein